MTRYLPTAVRLFALCGALLTASRSLAVTKIACVGDSITAGSDRYPTWLGQNLGSAYEVKNFGVAGTTMLKAPGSSYWKTTNFTASSDYLPNIVIIMLGTNDSKKIYWPTMGSNYESDYMDMILHYQGLASHPAVYLMTSPPNFTDGTTYEPTVIANEIVPIVRELTVATGSQLIDIFTPLTGHPELFSDGTHPVTAGSQLIAGVVTNVIQIARGAPRVGGTFEAESLAVQGSSLDVVRLLAEAPSSGGKTLMNDTDAVGDYVTVRLQNIAAGTYTLKVRFKKYTSRGIVQVLTGKIGGALGNLGSPIDLYASSVQYADVTIGTWTVSTSDKQIQFKIVGKNASSSGYTQCIDTITLTPQ